MQQGWTRARIVFCVLFALLLLLVGAWANRLLLPFVLAVLVAYVLTPAVASLEARRVPRAVSIITVYLVASAALTAGVVMTMPLLYREFVSIRQDLPDQARRLTNSLGPRVLEPLNDFIEPKRGEPSTQAPPQPALVIEPLSGGAFGVHLKQPVELVAESPTHWQLRPIASQRAEASRWLEEVVAGWLEYARTNVMEVVRVGRALASTAIRGVLLTFMMLMCAAYLIHTRDEVFAFARSLVPANERTRFDRLLTRLDQSLNGVVRGQLLICVINGFLSGIGFALLDVDYWPLLTLVATVFSIIPVFGALISSVPAVLVAFAQDPWLALRVLLWIIGIHQIEANFSNPKIIGTMTKLHPVLVVFALLLGERRGASAVQPLLDRVREHTGAGRYPFTWRPSRWLRPNCAADRDRAVTLRRFA